MSSRIDKHTDFIKLDTYHRKERILDVATELFAKKGYEKVTTMELAASIGCSESSLFNIFPTKAAIYEEIFAEWQAMLRRPRTQPIIQESAMLTLEHLFLSYSVNTLNKNPLMRPYLEDAVYSVSTSGGKQRYLKELAEAPDFVKDQLVPIVQYGQEKGEIRSGDPQTLASIFWNLLAGANYLHTAMQKQYPDSPICFNDIRYIFEKAE